MIQVGNQVVYINCKGRKFDASVTKIYPGTDPWPVIDLTFKNEKNFPTPKTKVRPLMGSDERIDVYCME